MAKRIVSFTPKSTPKDFTSSLVSPYQQNTTDKKVLDPTKALGPVVATGTPVIPPAYVAQVNPQIVNTALPTQQEIFKNAAEQNKGNPQLYNYYMGLANQYDNQFSNTANAITALYDNYNKQVAGTNQDYLDLNSKLNQDVVGRLNSQLAQVNAQYGPGGELRTSTDQYYNDIYRQLANEDAQRQQEIANEGVRTGVGSGAVRVAQAENQNLNTGRYLDARKQEVTDLQNLYKTYNDYLTAFDTAYAGSQDKYVLAARTKIADEQKIVFNNLLQQQQNLYNTELNTNLQIDAENRQAARTAGSSVSGTGLPTGTGGTTSTGVPTGGDPIALQAAQLAYGTANNINNPGQAPVAVAPVVTPTPTAQAYNNESLFNSIVQTTVYKAPDGSPIYRLQDGRGVYFAGGSRTGKPTFVNLQNPNFVSNLTTPYGGGIPGVGLANFLNK